MRAPPHTEVASRGLRPTRGRSPWYGRWWVWMLLVLVVLLAFLVGRRMQASTSGWTCTLTLTADRTVSASFTDQFVLGYDVGYAINDSPIDQIDWTALTHFAFAPLTVNADLSLNLTFDDQKGRDVRLPEQQLSL